MPDRPLTGRTIAIVATDGFEQSELLEPLRGLREAGAMVDLVAPEAGTIKGWNHGEWGESVDVDHALADADPDRYDALVLPGGVMNPDQLRMNDGARRFVQSFFDAGKPVSAICHGPQVLIDCDAVRGRTMTSYPSIRRDLENAGATWRDEAVVTDGNLTTSRTPDDLEAFIGRTIEAVQSAAPAAGVRG